MIKSTNKRTRRSVIDVFLTGAAMMIMTIAGGCRDSSVTVREVLDAELVNSRGSAWEIVCAGQAQCDPENTRAIVFDSNKRATLYNVAAASDAVEPSWSQLATVDWFTTGNTLYITYANNCVERYSFVIDDLLTLRAENATCVSAGNHPTVRKSIAGFKRTSIPAYTVNFSAASDSGTVSVTTLAGVPIESGASVPAGTVLIITATPNDGYFLTPSSLTVNGNPFPSGNRHTVSSAVNIDAAFTSATFPVTFAASENGAIFVTTSTGDPINSGDIVPMGTVLTITADAAPGYMLARLTVNGNVTLSGSTHRVNGAVSIAATFTVPTHQVDFNNSAGGTLSVVRVDGTAITNGDRVPVGTVLRITATPVSGYRTTLTVNGTRIITNAEGTTHSINHTVSGRVSIGAVFSDPNAPHYYVTFTASPGGTLSVTTTAGTPIVSGTLVNTGTEIQITASPNTSYALAELTVDHLPFGSGMTHTVTGTTEISATFSPRVAIPAPSAGGRVSVKTLDGVEVPNGAHLNNGTEVTITAAPNDGFRVSSLTVNGNPHPNGGEHTVDGPLNIGVSFGGLPTVGFSASPPDGGRVSVMTSAGIPVSAGDPVDIGEVLTITATENRGYRLSRLTVNNAIRATTVNGQTHTATHTVTSSDPVNIAATFERQGEPSQIVNSTPNPDDMTPAEKARYGEYQRRKNGGDDVQFSNTWLLLDATEETHVLYPEDGKLYAASGVFRENGVFWVVGIPLLPDGNVDYNSPAKYTEAGNYTSVRGTTTINITALQLTSGRKDAFSGTPAALEFPDGEREMTIIRNDNGKSHNFIELRCLVLEYDPKFVVVLNNHPLVN